VKGRKGEDIQSSWESTWEFQALSVLGIRGL